MPNLTKKEASQLQERRIANELGWRTVTGSGAVACRPGDILSSDWIGECKTHVTEQSRIVFHKKDWDKLKAESTASMRYPVLFSDTGTQKVSDTWCIFQCGMDPSSVVDIPEGVHVNDKTVSFIGVVMRSCMSMIDSKVVAYRFKWHGEMFYVTTLDKFREMINEENV